MTPREAAIAAFTQLYDEMQRIQSSTDNRDRATAYSELAGGVAELLRASGLSAAFDVVAKGEMEEVLAGGGSQEAALISAASLIFTRYGHAFMPLIETGPSSRYVASDLFHTAKGQWTRTTRTLLHGKAMTRENVAEWRLLISGSIIAAHYAAKANAHTRGWKDEHYKLLPSDREGYPGDRLREEWKQSEPAERIALAEAAGDARRQQPGDKPLVDPALASFEDTARQWIANAEHNTAMVAQIFADLPKDERARKPKNKRRPQKPIYK